jgi:TonB-linked SusC/RagA family outer membrane protein
MITSIRKAFMAVVILTIASAFGWGTTAVCAQGQSVSGRVTDAQDGGPLPGVNVVAVGTNVGTTTNTQGLYDLNVPANVDSLSFSFVGYATQTVAIGGRSEIDVALQPQVQQLGDVVVTALGIERQERSLGYAAQQVDAAELEETGQPDVLSALSGKVSGVTITNTGGAPGGSSRIIIRGLTSLNPNANNQPLFVVDGVPIDNSTIEAGDTPRSLSNRATDIDPNNIESINVLKSGAATALYGTRAANGAVIITTKSGQAGEMQVNISSTAAAERVARYPEFQTVYGQGFGGEATTDSFWPNWGAPIAEVADTLEGWQYYDIWRDAMQTGTLFDNAVSVSGGNEDVTYYGSVSNLQQRGVIPFGDRDRTSVKLSSQIQPYSTLNVSSSVSYTNSGGNHVPADRFMERLMYWAPTKDVTNFEQPSGIQRGYYGNGSSGTNPLYDAKYSTYETDLNRVIGNVSLDYDPLDWMNLTYRLGIDYYNDDRTNITPGPLGIEGENPLSSTGFITEDRINSRDLTSTVNVTLQHDLTDEIGARLLLGNDVFDRELDRVIASGNDFVTPRFFRLSNVRNLSSSQVTSRQRLIGVYGDLSLDYNEYLYLNLTARNDWSSTLPEQNRSFFYPSVSMSFLFSEVFELPDLISYGQLRASFAEVGKDAEPYLTSVTYTSPGIYPLDGRVGYTRSNLRGTNDLKPERTTSYEVGLDLRFLNSRLGIDATFYQSNSADQILRVPVSNATGFTTVATNAGEIRNRGIELQLNATPVQTSDFTWDATLNFARNRNTVVSIREGIDEIVVGSQFGYAGSSPTIKLVEGDAYGNIYGTSYQRYYPPGEEPDDPERIDADRPILIGEDGFPVVNRQDKVLGNSQPDWTAGLSNTLAYKGLTLSFLVDAQVGLDVFNQFDNFFTAFGITEETLARNEFRVFEGVTADGTPNTQEVWLGQGVGPDGRDYGAGYYRNVKRAVTEEFVNDASFVKLRNIRLSWRLPERWLGNATLVEQVRVSAGLNNIILYTPLKNAFDPESRSGGAGTNATGFTGLDYPGTSSLRFSLDVTL